MGPSATEQLALQALYHTHRGWLEGWLSRRLGCRWDAADLSQDTFVRVMTSAQPVSELQQPRAYLKTIGQRLVANLFNRRRVERHYLQALAQLPEALMPSEEQRWLLLEALQALDALLDGLPAKVRQAFLLSQLEGLTYHAIGERLGVTERSIKRYMAQAYEHCLLAELC